LEREKENNKDSLVVIHHAKKYEGKMPLWVIVELLSFTNLSKLYSAMYYKEQDIIAKNMGTTRQTLKNHLHCMANFRNKVAHAGRLYNAVYNPPVMLGRQFLQRNPDIHTDTLFAYLVTLMRRIPNMADRSTLAMSIINITVQYADYIQLSLLGFPTYYIRNLCNEIR
jgi:abortive infection bacteriophage resistance protein